MAELWMPCTGCSQTRARSMSHPIAVVARRPCRRRWSRKQDGSSRAGLVRCNTGVRRRCGVFCQVRTRMHGGDGRAHKERACHRHPQHVFVCGSKSRPTQSQHLKLVPPDSRHSLCGSLHIEFRQGPQACTSEQHVLSQAMGTDGGDGFLTEDCEAFIHKLRLTAASLRHPLHTGARMEAKLIQKRVKPITHETR